MGIGAVISAQIVNK